MKPKEILARLETRIGSTGEPQRLRDVLEDELVNYFGLPSIQAAERAEQWEEPVRRLIARSQNESEFRGTYSTLSISSVNDQIVLGSSWVGPLDAPEVAAAKRRRLHIEPLLQQIQNLTFNQFELFGACVLRELGARTVNVTAQSDDQGIDFYGVLSLGQNSGLPVPFSKLAYDVELRFAGQAKHYPKNPIGPELIRELVGAVALARHKVFTTIVDPFEDFGLRPLNPLLALFFTTGRFTQGAAELAQNSGIVARSGEQLAVFLADRGVGIEEVDGELGFHC